MGGGDKCLADLGNATLLARVQARLHPQVAQLALNANGDPQRFAQTGLKVIPDTIAGFAGPLAGVLAGLDWAAAIGATRVVTVAADTPFFPTDLVARLEEALSAQYPIVLAATKKPGEAPSRQPTCAVWPTACREALRASLRDGVRKVVAFTDAIGCTSVNFSAAPFDPFFNVNTPEDMQKAAALMKEFDL